ncbi:MAG: SCO family protein [Spirochaetia bacterium]|nr:SCO family protein [Spirochaetia bacterium]
MENQKKSNVDIIEEIQDWLAGWKFPIVTLYMMFFIVIFFFLVLVYPESDSVIGQFAEDFKRWCYGYDPATGKLEIAYVVMFLTDPFIIATVIYYIWREPVRKILKEDPKQTLRYGGYALAIVLISIFGMLRISSGDKEINALSQLKTMEFPADNLRTEIPARNFKLIDHKDKQIELNNYKGNVVIVTAFYTNCLKTCPAILFQLRKIVESIDINDRKILKALAITLDPEKDTKENMVKTAKDHKLITDEYHLLNGKPENVYAVLEQYEIPRIVNEKTGEIDHPNVFILIDKQGKIAYRFTLGELQEKWMKEALEILIKEA